MLKHCEHHKILNYPENDDNKKSLCEQNRQKPAEKPTNKYEHITLLNGYKCIVLFIKHVMYNLYFY